MMARIATIPLNPKATKAANDEFYQDHPEMIQDGERIPIDSCNPAHAKYQKEWMDSYIENGGKTRIGKEQKQCGQTKEPCPCNGRLVVKFTRGVKKEPISGARVAIYGPVDAESQTTIQGTATFEGLLAGSYQIEAWSPDQERAMEVAQVECKTTTGASLQASEKRSLKVIVINALSNELVSGAKVLVENAQFGESQDEPADSKGEALFGNLEAGTYEIKVLKDVSYVKNPLSLAEIQKIIGATSKTLSEKHTTVRIKVWPIKKVPLKWHQKNTVMNLSMGGPDGPRTHQVTYKDLDIKEYDFVRDDYFETISGGSWYNYKDGFDSYSYEQDCTAVYGPKNRDSYKKKMKEYAAKGWYIFTVLVSGDTEQEIQTVMDKMAKEPKIEDLFERYRSSNG